LACPSPVLDSSFWRVPSGDPLEPFDFDIAGAPLCHGIFQNPEDRFFVLSQSPEIEDKNAVFVDIRIDDLRQFKL